MSILRNLARRDITFQTLWGSGADILDYPSNTLAGVRLDQKSALAVTTFYACVSLMVDTISTLPVGTFRRSERTRIAVPRPEWMFQPEADNPSSSWEGHIAEVVYSLLLDGNAFVWTVRDDAGEVIELRALDPSAVELKRVSGGILYEYTATDGSRTRLDDTQVRHIWKMRRPGALRGISPIDAQRGVLGKQLATDQYGARFYGTGATMSGYIKTDAKMSQESADELKAKFKARHSGIHNAHDVGVLDAGAEWKQLSVTPEQAQFLMTLEHGDEAAARIVRVPPPLVGITKPGSMAFASVEALLIAFEKFTVRPWVETLETAYRPLLPIGQFVRIDTAGLLRGDLKARYEAYQSRWNIGSISQDEIRALEDEPPLPNGLGQSYYVPMNVVPIGQPVEQPAPQETPA